LNKAEKNYWPTEIEIAGTVWAIRKLKHMIKSSKTPTNIFIDHGAITGIIRQRSMQTESTDRSNLRLVRASMFLQQFNLNCYHKPGAKNVIPDTLSRLDTYTTAPELEELDFDAVASYNYTASLIKMSAEFKQRLVLGYQDDKAYSKILGQLRANDALHENKAALPFFIDGDVIWHDDDIPRLCIPKSLIREILRLEHDYQGHFGFHRSFARISSQYFIRHLRRHLRSYIDHCAQCHRFQTTRHLPYGSLQPIDSPPAPFYTITIDFILGLPKSRNRNDYAMSVTDKYSKAITLIPGKKTWTAKQWADALITRLLIMNWGMPKAIISDRDRKFLSVI
ncbi:MAG: hypothetical protein ABSA33_04505, partial [Candidatus Micrarchaeaceae archaeon]